MLTGSSGCGRIQLMLFDLAQTIVGIALLYWGGEWLVKGATQLASVLSVGRVVIGLTVVAFGTSAPELAASLIATFSGVPEVAYGNVVGSNIANIGLILGVAALIVPLRTSLRFLLRQVPFMILVTVLGLGFAWDGRLARIEGVVLLLLLAAFVRVLFRRPNTDQAASSLAGVDNPINSGEQLPNSEAAHTLIPSVLITAAGIGLLTIGANVLIQGATGVAVTLGISKRVIGLTLVAVGTSIPELAAAIVATAKREYDLVLGNVVGSNIFNILAVFGATATINPFRFGVGPTPLEVYAVMGFAIAMIPLMIWGLRISRTGGVILLAAYAFYVSRLF